ncbi:unnamed protein product, partial [Dibothriocephalus latus]
METNASTSSSCDNSTASPSADVRFVPPSIQTLTGVRLYAQQMKACLVKRLHYVQRSKRGWFLEMVLPVCTILILMAVTSGFHVASEQPNMPLHPWLMADLGTPPQLATFFATNVWANELTTPNHSGGRFLCDLEAVGGFEPPTWPLATSDLLYNLTGYNISDYLLKTRSSFILKRYGGLEFVAVQDPTHIGAAHAFLSNRTLITGLLEENFNDTHFAILASTHPMAPPDVKPTKLDRHHLQSIMIELIKSMGTILALSYVPASFVIFLIRERCVGSKSLQFMSGLNRTIYWLSAYLWDVCNFLVPVIIIILIFLAFHEEAYVGADSVGAFI